jgi:hypothetical protein
MEMFSDVAEFTDIKAIPSLMICRVSHHLMHLSDVVVVWLQLELQILIVSLLVLRLQLSYSMMQTALLFLTV